MHVNSQWDTGVAQVRINRRADWFTQDNSRRRYWEQACPNGAVYTCSKWFDFGSTLLHEMLHALVLFHPQSVHAHVGASGTDGPQANTAHCNSTPAFDGSDDSTICPSGGAEPTAETRYESSRRTVSQYDLDTITRHYQIN